MGVVCFFPPILRRPAGAFKQGHDLSSLAGHVSNVCRGKENRRFTTQMQMCVYIYTYMGMDQYLLIPFLGG